MTSLERNTAVIFGGKSQRNFIYQDEQCVAFEAEDKQSPVHFVVVPRKVVPRLCDATAADEAVLGHMLLLAKKIASERGLDRSGFHTLVDENHRSGRLVALHVFERSLMHMLWPTSLDSRL